MDTTTLTIQNPSITLVETLEDDILALLAQAGFTIAEVKRLQDPKERIESPGWIY